MTIVSWILLIVYLFIYVIFWGGVGQKSLDFRVQVYRVWCKEATQALQNGTEEAIAWGGGEQLFGVKPDLLYCG